MEIFVVEIGRATRRGIMEVLARRFVQSDMGEYRLKEAFEESYKGFDVRVQKVEQVMDTAVPPATPPLPKDDTRIVEQLEKVKVEHLDEASSPFNELYKAAQAAWREYRRADKALVDGIDDAFVKKEEVTRVGGIAVDYSRDYAIISTLTLEYPIYIKRVTSVEDPRD